MRPLYETARDVAHEQEIMRVVRERWRLSTIRKLPIKLGVDYALMRGARDIVAYAEIKDRPGLPWGFGDGYYLATSKIIAGTMLTVANGLPCRLIVRTKEGRQGSVDFTQRQPGAIWAGRNDRNDSDDMEPHSIFAWEDFTEFKP